MHLICIIKQHNWGILPTALAAGPLSFSSAVPLLGYAAELFGLTSAAKHRRQLTAPNADLLVSKEAAEDEHSLPPYGPPYNDDSVIAKQASLVPSFTHCWDA